MSRSTVEGCEKDNWDLSPDWLTEPHRTKVHLLSHEKRFTMAGSHTVYQLLGFAESNYADRPNEHPGIPKIWTSVHPHSEMGMGS
jgi:hypothetical protein